MIYKKLGDFVTLNQGLAINSGTKHLVKEEKDEEFVYPLLRIADMMENNFTKYISKNVNPSVIAKKEDIIYTRTGQIGLVFKGYNGVVHNNSFIVSLANSELNRDYLFVLLKSDFVREQALKLAKNSVQPDLTHDMFKSILIPFPNKYIQNKIAKIYNEFSNKIDLNNKINAELESMAKTLYDYWFLQFEFPNEEGKPYKSSGEKIVWNEELKREIPEGWEIIKLKDIFSFIKGKIPERLYDVNGDNLYPYITIDVANNGVCQYCNKENMPFCDGEVIMVMDGAASGDIYIGNEGVLGSTFAMMSKKKADISDALLYCILQAQSTLYKKANTGSTVPHANRKFIEEIKIPIKSDMSEFSTVFDNIFNIIIFNKKENQELASLRDFLLPLLMNGQVGFKE